MTNQNIVMRIARQTDNLALISKMYEKGLGFKILSKIKDHQDFDGFILGHHNYPYHLEFTAHKRTFVGKAPTPDNLLIFYIPDANEWKKACSDLAKARFQKVISFNPYWDNNGVTFKAIELFFRIVLGQCNQKIIN